MGLAKSKVAGIQIPRIPRLWDPVLSPPRVELRNPEVDFPAVVYPRLLHHTLTARAKGVLYDLTHGLVRNRARLYEKGRVDDEFCQECPGVPQDEVHIYCSCFLVRDSWKVVKRMLVGMMPNVDKVEEITDQQFLQLAFPTDVRDGEVVFVLGTYIDLATVEAVYKYTRLKPEFVIGHIKSKMVSKGMMPQ